MSLAFLLTSLVVVATPGTGVLYTLAAGLSRGARGSVLAAFACTLGIVPHVIAAITGLAALLHASAVAFQTLKYLGVTYLLYMAWSTWREHGALAVEEDAAPIPARKVLASGVLINVLNPKLTIFFFAFLPQFVSTGSSGGLAQMVALSAVFMLLTFVVFALTESSRPASAATSSRTRACCCGCAAHSPARSSRWVRSSLWLRAESCLA
jgi:threonine/homoserine/homoserine lactone efflux protein